MLLEDILKEWDKDSQIDKNKLDTYSIEQPKLIAKYIRILSHERMVLKKYESDYKELRLDKLEFYVDGPTEEQIDKGWEIPAKGRILKSEVTPYLEADKDIIKLSLKIGMQQEKIEVIKTIVDTISRVGFQIKNSIDFMRFMNGS